MSKVYIITATVGTPYLKKCVESVQAQDYTNIEHILVVDGQDKNIFDFPNVTKIILPWNTGRDNFICHKIYAAIPHLLHAPGYVMYLDEDNFIDPNHVSSLIKIIQQGYDWSFSLRKIIDKENNVLCNDECESLGNLSHTCIDKNDYLVDTSCYMVPIEIIRKFSECWQRRARIDAPEADRLFYYYLSKNVPNFKCSMQFTLNYRIEGRHDSVKAAFFYQGNKLKLCKDFHLK
jgi:glycosyltransferase involved in cell wall biosynthesis